MTRYRVLSIRPALQPLDWLVIVNAPDDHMNWDVYVPTGGEPMIQHGLVTDENKLAILDLAVAAVAVHALGGNVRDIVV